MSKTNSEDPTKWAQLLSLASESQTGWLEDDLAHFWQHQMHAPLDAELAGESPNRPAAARDSSAPSTLAMLLTHPSPPLELLKLAKNRAKAWRGQVSFPSEIATVIYYTAIAAAWARHGERITELDDAALRTGFQWAILRPWIDEPIRGILVMAILK
jgi:hypothetical protein